MELIDKLFFTSLVVLLICVFIEKSNALEDRSIAGIAGYVNAVIGISSIVTAFALILIRIWQ